MSDNNTTTETLLEPGAQLGEPETPSHLPPRPPAKKPWAKYVGLAVLALGLFAFGRYTGKHAAKPAAQTSGAEGGSEAAKAGPTKYHCPMHPSYVSDKPGECPICGMTLVPIEGGDGEEEVSLVAGLAIAKVSPEKQQLIGLRKGRVTREVVTKPVRTVGIVEPDETLLAHVHTKFDGWIEKVYIDYEGKYVGKGKPLLTIYSPDLVATQEEYLLALKSRETLSNSEFDNVSYGGETLIDASRRRLQLWDIPDSEIKRIEKTGKPIRALTLYSPASGYVMKRMAIDGMYVKPGMELYTLADLSRVWVIGDLYEYEMALVKVGQRAMLTTDAHPNRTFHGKVDYLYPTLNERTRTAQVRFTFANSGMTLRPGMYVNITLEVPMGSQLVVSEEAVLDSGARKIIFVAKGEGKFEPREVQVGQKVGDKYVIESGVSEGEEIVVNGNFIIDSESRLKASLGGMGGMAGHNHGGGGGDDQKMDMDMPAGEDHSKHKAAKAVKSAAKPMAMKADAHKGHTPAEHAAMTKSTPAAKPKAAPGKKVAQYTCSMHPEVVQDHPGKCPKCGMYLEAKVTEGTKVTYVCPMPEDNVQQDRPGKCPKCGMFLEAKID